MNLDGRMADYVVSSEAAQMLGLRLGSISRLVKKGVLHGIKYGAQYLITRKSVIAYKNGPRTIYKEVM
jgi:excisionase family DNA binding protein